MALRINHKDNSIQFNEVAAPATPPAGTVVIYVGVDGKMYIKDDAGTDITSLVNIVEDLSPQLGADLDVANQAIVSNTAGNILITPDTTGSIILDGLSWPQADGTTNFVLETNGVGQLGWVAQSGLLNIVEDLSPQLGADLDVVTFLVKASDSTYLDLDDTITTLHAAGAYTVGAVGNITISPDNKAGAGATTVISAGRSTDGVGANLTLAGGQGVTIGGDIILTPGTGSADGIVQVTGDLEATGNVVSHITINAQTGTTYTLLLTDDGKLITMSNAAAITLTIPTNASVAFPIGTQILVSQEGVGITTIAGPGVTLHSSGGLLSTTAQYSTVSLIKKAIDTWLIAGDMT